MYNHTFEFLCCKTEQIQCIHVDVALNYFSKAAHQKKIFGTGFGATNLQGQFFNVLRNLVLQMQWQKMHQLHRFKIYERHVVRLFVHQTIRLNEQLVRKQIWHDLVLSGNVDHLLASQNIFKPQATLIKYVWENWWKLSETNLWKENCLRQTLKIPTID